jgi:hypothetical protein
VFFHPFYQRDQIYPQHDPAYVTQLAVVYAGISMRASCLLATLRPKSHRLVPCPVVKGVGLCRHGHLPPHHYILQMLLNFFDLDDIARFDARLEQNDFSRRAPYPMINLLRSEQASPSFSKP